MKRIFFAATLLLVFSMLAACSSNDVDTGAKDPEDTGTYTVTLNTTGGEDRAALQVLAGDTLEGLIENPTKEGFTFLGWSTSGEEIVYYDMSTPVTAAFTLYAVWSGGEDDGVEMYRLTVHLQGGAFRYVPVQTLYIDFKAGSLLKELPRMNTKPDHSTLEFAGWNTSPDGRGEIIVQDSELTGDLEIYAIYGELITTIDDLKAMTCNNSGVVYVIGYSDELADNLEDEEWVPLCSASQPFKGAIYRNFEESSETDLGTIALTISATSDHAGLFSYTDGAIFNELTISGTITGADYAGFFAGEMKDSRVENITYLLEYSTINGAQYGGTITGKGDNVTLLNIAVRANTSSGSFTGKFIGGVAGWLEDSGITDVSVHYVSPSGSENGSCVGGIAGYLKDSVMDVAAVLGSGTFLTFVSSDFEDSYVGVIAGFLENCEIKHIFTLDLFNSATANRDNSYAGSVAGGMQGGSIAGARVASPVYAYGDNSAAGGVVGKNTGASISDTIVRSTVYAQGSGNHAGGVVGVSESGTVSGNLVLSDSITGETAGAIIGSGGESGNVFVAGISVNNVFPAGGTAASAIRYNKDFFTDTLGWDFASIWEMKDYYDYPTFISDEAPDFIPITTAEELAAIGDSVDDLSKFYVLMNDLDLSTYNDGVWIPIGDELSTYDARFKGTFNGNGKTIRNLKIIGKEEDDSQYYALFKAFGYTVSLSPIGHFGAIKDLILEDVDIQSYSGSNAGLVADTTSYGLDTIERVHVTGNISGGKAGGITGYGYGKIIECSFVGNVSGSSNVGGLVGDTGNNLYVSKSFSAGTVTAETTNYSGPNCGGLIGGASRTATIKSCYSTSTVTATAARGIINAGGLVGYTTANVLSSYATGDLSITTPDNACVGGIIGYLGTYAQASNNVALMSSITTAIVGTADVGRIVGDVFSSSSRPERNATSTGNYALATLALGGGVDADEGTDVASEDIDEAFFRSLGWDMDYLWIFDTDSQRPVFRWQ